MRLGAIICFFPLVGHGSLGPLDKVNIKLNLKAPSLKITAPSPFVLQAKGLRRSYPPQMAVRIHCQRFSPRGGEALLAQVSPQGPLVDLNGRSYRGKIKIYKDHTQRECFAVAEMPLEDYIQSVLPKEMSSSWPLEALKAQAVASRTYALHRVMAIKRSKEAGPSYDLENSEKDQVSGPVGLWTSKTAQATKQTQGLVLADAHGEVIQAFFHAKCGGRTLAPHQVWGGAKGPPPGPSGGAYLRVRDPHCLQNPRGSYWFHRVGRGKFEGFLRRRLGLRSGGEALTVATLADSPEDPFLKLALGGRRHSVAKSAVRSFFGRLKVRSHYFRTLVDGPSGDYILYGNGHGHGVGMCQIGAYELSKKGWDYRKILKYYYPKMKVMALGPGGGPRRPVD